jgi:TonB family protein
MKATHPRVPRSVPGFLLLALFAMELLSAPAVESFVPPKIQQQVHVPFPVRAHNQGITNGEVRLYVEVDYEGKVGDVLAFAHSGSDFAQAAVDAIRRWRFTPALLAGQPIGSINRINVHFEINGVTTYTRMPEQSVDHAGSGERFAYRPYTLPELDRMPEPLSRSSPVYPQEWIRQGKSGVVSVEYFIDEGGRTRFPRVVGNPDELLGASAIAAVKTWQFEPPLRRGQRVLAQVGQEIHFRPDPAKAGFE